MAENFLGGKRVLPTGETTVATYVYDANSLSWQAQTAATAGSGGSVNITNPTLAVTQSGAWTVALGTGSNTIGNVSVNGTVPVSGSFWQATQPVSMSTVPLPTGAATESTLAALNAKHAALGQTTMSGSTPVVIASNQSAIPVSGSVSVSGSVPVTGTFWQTTQPVSLSSLPALPTGSNTIGSVNINGTVPVTVQNPARSSVDRKATTITSSTSATTVVAAAGSGVYADISSLIVTNSSTTATLVTLSDGTVSFVYSVPAGSGFTMPFSPPLPATSANTAWTLACGTSVASVYCNVVYVKNT
jgi:hypothetical protein